MTCPDRCRLLFGPYRPPRVRKGSRAFCLFRGSSVIVTSWSDGRLSWPRCQRPRQQGGSGLLVSDELRRAIESESAAALIYWLGVAVTTVWRWRIAFGVTRTNSPGSQRLIRAAARGGAAAMKSREWTPAERRQRSRRAKRLNLTRNILPCPRPGGSRPWTSAELRMIGTMPDEKLARRIGRTESAVRRQRWGIASADSD